MCGNGCLALCKKLKKNIQLISENKNLVNVLYFHDRIILQLSIDVYEKNIYSISGEPHKVYLLDTYDKKYHKQMGFINTPDYNTTFVFKKDNQYYFTTFERGVNDITQSCGTGSFASFHYIKNNDNIDTNNISYILTLDDKKYMFNTDINDTVSLIYLL